jgi:hypothetical protein
MAADFLHVPVSGKLHESVCASCGERIAISPDLTLLRIAERVHRCSLHRAA